MAVPGATNPIFTPYIPASFLNFKGEKIENAVIFGCGHFASSADAQTKQNCWHCGRRIEKIFCTPELQKEIVDVVFQNRKEAEAANNEIARLKKENEDLKRYKALTQQLFQEARREVTAVTATQAPTPQPKELVEVVVPPPQQKVATPPPVAVESTEPPVIAETLASGDSTDEFAAGEPKTPPPPSIAPPSPQKRVEIEQPKNEPAPKKPAAKAKEIATVALSTKPAAAKRKPGRPPLTEEQRRHKAAEKKALLERIEKAAKEGEQVAKKAKTTPTHPLNPTVSKPTASSSSTTTPKASLPLKKKVSAQMIAIAQPPVESDQTAASKEKAAPTETPTAPKAPPQISTNVTSSAREFWMTPKETPIALNLPSAKTPVNNDQKTLVQGAILDLLKSLSTNKT